MVTLAYLGRRLSGQLSGNPEGLEGVELVWQGALASRLLEARFERRLSVLVAELEQLGDDPVAALTDLRGRLDPELTLVLHHYARRETLSALLDGKTRTLQAPVSLSALRAQMLSLIVRDMLTPTSLPSRSPRSSSDPKPTGTPSPGSAGPEICPQCGARLAV